MYQTAAIARNPKRLQTARTKSLPAPVAGWNDFNSLADMPETAAVILDNWFPLPSKVMVRKGSSRWASGMGSQVESMMAYEPQDESAAAIFAAAGTSFYDVTDQGAVGAAVVTGLSNARWQHSNMATSGGNFLLAVNGVDKLRGWNGSAWWADGDGAHDITGVDTANCINISVSKRRVWLVEEGTANAWYLPVDSIAGAASKLDFGPYFAHGGYLEAIANWTLDGGNGPEDYSAFIGSAGDVAIFRGVDPSSVTTWALVGVFWLGSPIGRRCVSAYRGDVVLITQDGVYPLSQALTMNRDNTAVAFTNNIQNTMSVSAGVYGTRFGWQVIPFSGQNMLILNVPVSDNQQQQYVMNMITGAWCRFKGWGANCFVMFNDELYFGADGATYKAWQGFSDAGADINAEALQAFNYFGVSGLKEWTLARPLIAFNNSAGFLYGLNTDFDMSRPVGVPTFVGSNAGQWGSGLWGSAKWGGNPRIQRGWQGVAGLGYCAAMHLVVATNTGTVEWSATDYAFKRGGII